MCGENIRGVRPHGPSRNDTAHGNALGRRPGTNRIQRLAGRDAGHADRAGLQDAGLFTGDLGERIAQNAYVIQTDVGDNSNERRGNHVGRVQPSPDPHFQRHQINVLLGEPTKRKRGFQLKFGRFAQFRVAGQSLDVRPDRGHPAREIGFGDHAAVDLNALAQIKHVRRQVGSRSVSLRPQHGGNERGGRTLAVGAGHVNAAQFFVRVAEPGEQHAQPVAPQPHPELEPPAHVGDGLLKVHGQL
jgi:hypothetical protein